MCDRTCRLHGTGQCKAWHGRVALQSANIQAGIAHPVQSQNCAKNKDTESLVLALVLLVVLHLLGGLGGRRGALALVLGLFSLVPSLVLLGLGLVRLLVLVRQLLPLLTQDLSNVAKRNAWCIRVDL